MSSPLSRRQLLRGAALAAASLALPASLRSWGRAKGSGADGGEDHAVGAHLDPDRARLAAWTATLRAERLASTAAPLGRGAVRVGELAIGTPYEAFTLEEYLLAGGSPSRTEPLALSLTRFDCVSLVESCLAIARVASDERASWESFSREMERMRYRHGVRGAYDSRLHYFSDWIADGARRGLLHDLGAELGGLQDSRPLRFMTENRVSYPALGDDNAFRAIAAMERTLDSQPRFVVPSARIPQAAERIKSGDVLAFATSIPGLDVTHAAFAYRGSDRELRVLHAPLSGGVVEVTSSTLVQYVAAIRRATGILVARPLRG